MALMVLRSLIGLSKEGWYIIKYLSTEMAVLLCGYITFVPAIQVWTLSHTWSFALSHFPVILSFSFPNTPFPFSLFTSFPIPFISYPLNPSISHSQLSSFPGLHFSCSLFPCPHPSPHCSGSLFLFPISLFLIYMFPLSLFPLSLFPISLSSIFLHFSLNRKDQTVVIFLDKHIVFFFFFRSFVSLPWFVFSLTSFFRWYSLLQFSRLT